MRNLHCLLVYLKVITACLPEVGLVDGKTEDVLQEVCGTPGKERWSLGYI